MGWSNGAQGGGGSPSVAVNEYLGKNGSVLNFSANSAGNNRLWNLHPDVISTGSLIEFDGIYADAQTLHEGGGTLPACASHCDPTVTDNASATLTAVFTHTTCPVDTNGYDHNIWLDPNVASTTFQVKAAFAQQVTNNSFNIANFYNIATSSPAGGSSCKVDVLPTNNTAPNISGNSVTMSNTADAVLVKVDDEGSTVPTIGPQNPWGALTIPSGCTLENENTQVGELAMLCFPGTSTYTPAVTISQTTHDDFAIYAVELKNGSGGTSSPAGTHILAETQNLFGSGAASYTWSPACPSSTTYLTVTDDAGSITAISDSQSGSYTKASFGGSAPFMWYRTISSMNPNTFTLSITSSGAGTDLVVTYCSNAGGLDTGVTAGANGGGSSASTLESSGVVGNFQTEGATSGANAICFGTSGNAINCNDLPTIVTSLANDLIIGVCENGIGPMAQVFSPATGVMDLPYVQQTAGSALVTWTAPDTDMYVNGDADMHYFATTAGSIEIGYVVQQNAATAQCLAQAIH